MVVLTMTFLMMTINPSNAILVSYSSFVTKAKKNLVTNISFAVPDKCQHEVIGIESFFACLTERYNGCPIFFPGSLQDACKAAFSSTVVTEVRSHLLLSLHKTQETVSF